MVAVAAADRGPGEEGGGSGAGEEADLADWPKVRRSRAERRLEVGDLDDDADETGRFQSRPPSAPSSRPGRGQSSEPKAQRQGRPQRGDLTTRLLTGLGIGLAAVILFRLGSLTALVLVLLVVTPAAAELFGVLRRAGYRPATLVGLVATVGIIIGAYMKGEAAIPLVVGLVVVFTLLWYLVGVVRDRPTINIGVTFLGFMWVGFLGSFAALLLDPRIFPNRHGVALLLGAAVATVAYDVGSYLVGARFGRHHLAPAISPNKTWEGLIGGTLASVLVGAVVVSQINPWTTARGIALGLVVAVAAPLGDLCVSLVKRDIGVKDMGWILPGHGGVLDRVDALLFVVPATYYLVRLINFGG
jgi:phosphatidate cytidylyltransferase